MSAATHIGRRRAALGQVDADDPDAFNHCFAEVNGIRMHYIDEGQGPLVILLHGFPYLWYMWRRQIVALAEAGFRVVVPDQRGFGQTDRPDSIEAYDMSQAVGDMVGLMAALGETSAVIVGHDLGAWVAQAAAMLRPDLFRPRDAQYPGAAARKGQTDRRLAGNGEGQGVPPPVLPADR